MPKLVKQVLFADNQEKKLSSVVEIKKNVAHFNDELMWAALPIGFNNLAASYLEKIVTIAIHYQTLDSYSKTTNIKVGQVTVDLAKLLNTKNYRMSKQYALQKCYDSNAKLKISIDLQKIGEQYRSGIHTSSDIHNQAPNWRNTKLRDRLADDEIHLLQNKLSDYEHRIQQIRSQNKEITRRLSEQLQKKDEQIQILSNQSQNTVQSLQQAHLIMQRQKAKLQNTQKELKKNTQQWSTIKDKFSIQLEMNKIQIEQLKQSMHILSEGKQKKQGYYKEEIEKYRGKFIQTQNMRNKIVFEMESHLQKQLGKKDQYHKQTVQKMQQNITLIKNNLNKKQMQFNKLTQNYQQLQNVLVQTHKNELQKSTKRIKQLQQTIEQQTCQQKQTDNILQSSNFSNQNLQKQNNKLKTELKAKIKQNLQKKQQILLGNKTIEQQSSMLLKCHKNIKVLQQKQYIMSYKLDEQLQNKSYNKQYNKQYVIANYHYKGVIRKQLNRHILQDKIDEQQLQIQNMKIEVDILHKKLLQNEANILHKTQQIYRIQSQYKINKQKCQQLQLELNKKNINFQLLQHKLDTIQYQFKSQINNYQSTIQQIQTKSTQINNKQTIQKHTNTIQIKQLYHTIDLKNNKIKYLQQNKSSIIEEYVMVIQKLKQQIQINKKYQNCDKQLRNIKLLNKQLMEYNQGLLVKLEDIKLWQKQSQKLKSQLQKVNKQSRKEREQFVGLVKWIFERNWLENNRQNLFCVCSDTYIQQIVHKGIQQILLLFSQIKCKVESMQQQNIQISRLVQHQRVMVQMHNKQSTNYGNYSNYHLQMQRLLIPDNKYDLQRLNQQHQSVKIQNAQLQRDLINKTNQLTLLKEEIHQIQIKNKQFILQLRSYDEETEKLISENSKKTAQILHLNQQILQITMQHTPQTQSKDQLKDHRALIEQQITIQCLKTEIENMKSKITNNESKLNKVSSQNVNNERKIVELLEFVKQKDEQIYLKTGERDKFEFKFTKISKQLQLAYFQVAKYKEQAEYLVRQIEKLRNTNESLVKQNQEFQLKITSKQREFSKTIKQSKCKQTRENKIFTDQINEKSQNIMQLQKQISAFSITTSELKTKCQKLQLVIKRQKQQNQQGHEKYLTFTHEKMELQEKIKDISMSSRMKIQGQEKQIEQLRKTLQMKVFQMEEMSFKYESQFLRQQGEAPFL